MPNVDAVCRIVARWMCCSICDTAYGGTVAGGSAAREMTPGGGIGQPPGVDADCRLRRIALVSWWLEALTRCGSAQPRDNSACFCMQVSSGSRLTSSTERMPG